MVPLVDSCCLGGEAYAFGEVRLEVDKEAPQIAFELRTERGF